MSRFDRRYTDAMYGPNYQRVVRDIVPLRNSFLTRILDTDDDDNLAHVLHDIRAYNGAGAAAFMSVGNSLLNSKWIVGTWTAANPAGTQFTLDADKANVPLEVVGADNDGAVWAATDKFSALVLTCTAAVDGGGLVRAWQYWNGTAWATLTILSETASAWAAGRNEVVFVPPRDWALTTATAVDAGGIGAGYYAVKYGPTTAPDTTAGVMTSGELWHPFRFMGTVATVSMASLLSSDRGYPVQDSDEDIVAYTSVPDVASWVTYQGERTAKAQTLGE